MGKGGSGGFLLLVVPLYEAGRNIADVCPLIKSEAKGIAQVFDDLGNLFSFLEGALNAIHSTLFQIVAL